MRVSTLTDKRIEFSHYPLQKVIKDTDIFAESPNNRANKLTDDAYSCPHLYISLSDRNTRQGYKIMGSKTAKIAQKLRKAFFTEVIYLHT